MSCDYSTCSSVDALERVLDGLVPNADGSGVGSYSDGYSTALADVAAAFGLQTDPGDPTGAPAARLADALRDASLRYDFTSARVLELADGSRRWAVLAEYVHGNGERTERLTLEHDGRVTRETLS